MLFNCISLILIGLSWGITIPLIKITVDAGHHPLGLIFWQMLLAVLILGVYLRIKRLPVPLTAKAIRFYLVIAFLGTLIPNTFSLLATRQLPAGIMSIAIATVPMLSLCVALLIRQERFSWIRSLGVVLGVCALCLVAIPDASLPDPAKAPWLLVALIAPFCYACEGNFVAKKGLMSVSPLAVLFGASCCGVLMLAPVVWFEGLGVSLTGHWDKSLWALLGSSIGHVIAYSGYLWLLNRAGAVFASQVGYVVTLTGVVGAMVLLGENYGVTVWLAIALMLAGVALVRPVSRHEPVTAQT